MDEYNPFSDDYIEDTDTTPWIEYMLDKKENSFFCKIPASFLSRPFNTYGLEKIIEDIGVVLRYIFQYNPYSKQKTVEYDEKLEKEAKILYGLVHTRFITSPEGLKQVKSMFLHGRFGHCPRVLCVGQNLLPYGLSSELNKSKVIGFCLKCCNHYHLPGRNLDGAFFGPSFPDIFILEFPEITPEVEMPYHFKEINPFFTTLYDNILNKVEKIRKEVYEKEIKRELAPSPISEMFKDLSEKQSDVNYENNNNYLSILQREVSSPLQPFYNNNNTFNEEEKKEEESDKPEALEERSEGE